MTWLYIPSLSVPVWEDLTLASNSLVQTTYLFVLSNDKPTAQPLSWRGWKVRSWIGLLFGTISRPLTAARGAEWWIWSLLDTRASQTHTQDSSAALMTSAGCGMTSGASFAKWDLGSSSWRTCQATFMERSDEWSEPWPRAGGVLNGTAFQREPSAPLMSVIGCSFSPVRRLLPTPTAREIKGPTGPSHSDGLSSALGILRRKCLSPEFVEWMMGLPIGWSAIGLNESTLSEIQSSQRRRQLRGGLSSGG